MPEVWGNRLHLGLTQDGAAAVRSGGWPRRRVLAQSVQAWTAPGGTMRALATSASLAGPVLDALLAELASGPGRRRLPVDVVLADDLTRHWIVTPPANARSVGDCRLAAQARFQTVFGQSIEGWHWDADWRADRPFLCSALPQDWLAVLQQSCARHGLALGTVAPELVTSWNRWRRQLLVGDWLASACGQRVTLVASDAGGLLRIGRLMLPAGAVGSTTAARGWLQQAVRREALRWMLEMPSRLLWSGEAPAPWPQAGDAATDTGPDAAANASPWACVAPARSREAADCLATARVADRPALHLALAAW